MLKKHLTKSNNPSWVLERSMIQGTYIKIMKAVYSKLTANIKLNGEKFKVILLKSEDKAVHCPYLFNIVLEILAIAIRQQKDINGVQNGNEEVKLSLLVEETIVYISDPKTLSDNSNS